MQEMDTVIDFSAVVVPPSSQSSPPGKYPTKEELEELAAKFSSSVPKEKEAEEDPEQDEEGKGFLNISVEDLTKKQATEQQPATASAPPLPPPSPPQRPPWAAARFKPTRRRRQDHAQPRKTKCAFVTKANLMVFLLVSIAIFEIVNMYSGSYSKDMKRVVEEVKSIVRKFGGEKTSKPSGQGAKQKKCPNHLFVKNEVLESCYQFVHSPEGTEKMNWMRAKGYCESENAHLLNINSNAEQKIIAAMIDRMFDDDDKFWIGANNLEGVWQWSDTGDMVAGTDAYENWADIDNETILNDPQVRKKKKGTKCAMMKLGRWYPVNCGEPKQFICEYELR